MQWNAFRSCVSHLSVKDQGRLEQAFKLGREMHGDQKRMSGEPYFSHPIAVAQILAGMGGDADTIIAALLHDTIEDTDLKLEIIEKKFGDSVAVLIDGVTKLSEEDVKLKPKEDEQIETLRKMFTLMQKDIRIMIIKLADRLHNMQTAEYLPAGKRNALAQETLDVYVKIAERLSMQQLRNELEGLCLSTLKPTLFNELTSIRQQNEETGQISLKKMERAIKKLNGTLPKRLAMKYEPKTWPKVRAQHDIREGPVTGISAITIVFICPEILDCFHILGVLHQLWKRESLSFQDFINSPRINGYRGLHTTIILEDGIRVRCKIRTEMMQEYARAGVAKYCFDSKSKGFMSYVDWTQRIAPLSEDTVERSEDFWESLKSDILGESILIHGPGDQTVQLPKESTALDGAFYFFGDKALKVQDIIVNGNPVKFYEPLPYACSVAATFSRKEQVDFSWLQYVNTGTASALIHKGLAKAPHSQKQEFGKKLLDQALKEHGRVGINELTVQTLEEAAKQMGPHSAIKLFEQIAEGKVQAREAALLLVPKYKNGKGNFANKRKWTVNISYPLVLSDEVTKILRTFRPRKLTYKILNKTKGKVRAEYSLSMQQQQQLRSLLNTILQDGGWSLHPSSRGRNIVIAFITLLMLWGLDPVVAHIILQQKTVDAFELTLIRFITLSACATLVFSAQSLIQRRSFKPLSPFDPWLLWSAIALFLTAFCSYLALSNIPATQYILYIIAGIVLGAVIDCINKRIRGVYKKRTKRCVRVIGSFALILAAIAVLSYLHPISPLNMLFAALSGVGFAVYSHTSKSFLQKKAMVTARYPAFLFWLSLICLVFSLALAPLHSFDHIHSPSLITLSVLFVIVFNAIPYFLFFEIIRRVEGTFLDNTLPFVYIATAIGEILVTGSLTPLIVLPFILVFFWQFAVYLRSS